ncbi:MAG TPA: hypothetical protein VFS43_24660 [Polyangiaceae bacterium]|nr:hypothetical protein [Polyangiaceae bacterium]
MTVAYGWLVVLHSWGRWAVFLSGVLVAARAPQGRASGRAWVTARRLDAGPARLSRLGLGALAALGLAALATPWPALAYERPLLHVP